jgi:hypothetical protein
MKVSVDCQPSVLRIDESLSPASLDSVIVAERDMKVDKYTSGSPLHSPECLEADQVTSVFLQCCIYSRSLRVYSPFLPNPQPRKALISPFDERGPSSSSFPFE